MQFGRRCGAGPSVEGLPAGEEGGGSEPGRNGTRAGLGHLQSAGLGYCSPGAAAGHRRPLPGLFEVRFSQ